MTTMLHPSASIVARRKDFEAVASFALTPGVPAEVDAEFNAALDDYCATLKDTMLAEYDAAGVRSLAFNPDQPRDDHGRWAGDNGSTWSQSDLEKRAATLADKFNYPIKKITISGRQETVVFKGEYRPIGGKTDSKGNITIYPGAMDDKQFEGVLAHEVGHAQLNKWLPRAWGEGRNIEALKARGLSDAQIEAKTSNYRVAHEFFNDSAALEGLRASGMGVSDYARAYWESVPSSGLFGDVFPAVHETLAEISRIYHETGEIAGGPSWQKIYKQILASNKR